MLKGRFNVVTDGQWGSCGKGAVTTALAHRCKPEILSTTNMANAGHTAVNSNGDKFIAKALPSATALHKWYPDYDPAILVGPSSAFDLVQMIKEVEFCNVAGSTFIHPRAGVITETHRQIENDMGEGTKHIASTMQGCGAFLADKIMRRKSIKLARDYSQLDQLVTDKFDLVSKTSSSSHGLKEAAVKFSHLSMPRAIRAILQQGGTALHEGSQGFSLDINHGSHYPECTSRSTTAIQNIADMGIAHSLIGDIYLVIRPYPIRVGNVIENGQTIGYSGDCYSDHKEISWEEVAKEAGAPPEEMQKELTTVTKRLRRVFTFSKEQLIEAVEINGATKIALNFANYIDWACYGMNDYEALPQKVKNFILDIEDIARIPVTIVGTGPQLNHICYAE